MSAASRVYLLDSNRPENPQHHRDLTRRVYGGDNTMRIMQEMLLGVGGVRLLRALGIQPSVFHMNEGHAAFLTLELIREKMAAGLTFDDALAAHQGSSASSPPTRRSRPGHDRFSHDLIGYALVITGHLNPFDELMGLGRVDPKDRTKPSA